MTQEADLIRGRLKTPRAGDGGASALNAARDPSLRRLAIRLLLLRPRTINVQWSCAVVTYKFTHNVCETVLQSWRE